MKTIFLTLTILSLIIVSCKTTKSVPKNTITLQGKWQLNYITGPRIAFQGLYPDRKPTIDFDLNEKRFSGSTSCNQYFGNLLLDGNKINFKDAKTGMTRMVCQGTGEVTYMKTLETVDSYSITGEGTILNLNRGDVTIMRFNKIEFDKHNSHNSLDWVGTYKGVMPCADCEGIETVIVLHKNLSYIIRTKYLGKADAEVFEEKGNFEWLNNGSVVHLKGIKGKPSKYKLTEDKLIQLDMEGNTITGALAGRQVLLKNK